MAKPVVTAELNKGDFLKPRRLSALFGYPIGTQNYVYHRHMLIERIQEESNAMGAPVLCRAFLNGIRILTDEEALVYKERQYRRCLKKLNKIRKETKRIDRRNLDKENKHILDHQINIQDIVCRSIMKVFGEAFGGD